jgi:hypothetical protein
MRSTGSKDVACDAAAMHPIPFPAYHRSRAAAIVTALAACAATIALSGVGAPAPSLPALAVALGADRALVIGLALPLLAGLVAFHAARLSIQPAGSLGHAALPSALAALLLMPDASTVGMLPALIAASMLPLDRSADRITAILVLCGALLALLGGAAAITVCGLFIMILLLAGALSARRSAPMAANDNIGPHLQASSPWLGLDLRHVTFAGESSGEGGNSSCSTKVRAATIVN